MSYPEFNVDKIIAFRYEKRIAIINTRLKPSCWKSKAR